MANKDLIKEYDEWKKKRDSREYNYDYDNGVSSDDLVGEYNSWKKNYEASQQRVKPAARLSQPSPLMQAATASPLGMSTEQMTQQFAQNAYANLVPAKREEINAKAQAYSNYGKMSQEERRLLEQKLKAQMAAPMSLSGASITEEAAAKATANQAAKELAQLHEYNSIYDPVWQAEQRLHEYARSAEDIGEYEYNHRDKLTGAYIEGFDRLGNALESAIGVTPGEKNGLSYEEYTNIKQQNSDYAASQKAYDEALTKLKPTNGNLQALAEEGAGLSQEDIAASSILDNKKVSHITAALNDRLRGYTDAYNGRYIRGADYLNEAEKEVFYAYIARGDWQSAVSYVNSLENQLLGRAQSAITQSRSQQYQSEGFIGGGLHALADTAASIPENFAGSLIAGGDFLAQELLTGKYDPYSANAGMARNARQTREATGDFLTQETGSSVPAFLYNVGVSAVESAIGAKLGVTLEALSQAANAGKIAEFAGRNAYMFIMSSGAAASRAEELYNRGASDMQVFVGALTSGINEALFEKLSLENLMHPEKYANRLARILAQAGIEGSEEVATDIANNIADSITLGDKSDYNEKVRQLMAENPGMTREQAEKEALNDTVMDVLLSGLAGALSGGASAAAYDFANRTNYVSNRKIGKNISSNYQAENTVKQGLEADENSEAYKLAKNIDERQNAGKKVSNKALGELARALDTELTEKSGNALAKAFEYRREAAAAETVENALKENGATDEEAADLAPLVSKSILGEELTDSEQAKIDNNTAAVRYMDEVASKTSEISGETGLQQLSLRVNATTRGTGSTKASDRLRESALDKVFETAMKNELKPAKLSDNEIGKANETSYKVSTTGKTTYNGKAVNIDTISEIGDGNALVTLDNGETAKLSDIEFADKGEAVAWQTITSIDGITPQAATSLIAQYKNKPANVTASVWARGIAEGYEIGRSGKLGTKEFPKAEASAKYLSNIGNDARRISETVGRQDARFERHKEAIEVDRKNVNNKNVNDAADTLDKMGRKYKIVEGIDGDGYIEKDGTIVLNKDAKDPIGFVLKHELTHYAETSKDYDGFVKAVKGSRAFAAWIDKQSLKDGTQLQQEADYLRRLKDRYRRHGVTLTNTEAHREMIANFVGDTLFNENGVGLDGLVNGMNAADRNAVMRFLTKIADFFRRHFTKKGERAYLEHFFSQLQNTATGERAEEKTYTFAGENAATSNVQTLSEAKELIEQGADPEEVRQQTGWFKGMDGKWRFEIDDSRVKLNTEFIPQDLRDLDLAAQEYYNEVKTRHDAVIDKMNALARNGATTGDPELQKLWKESLRLDKKLTEADRFLQRARSNSLVLSDILVHPALYKAYPSLKNKRITLEYKNNSYLGQSRSDDLGIVVEGQHKEDILSTILHEVQHEMQKIEGFAKGSNPQWWAAQLSAQNEDIKKAETTKTGIQKKLEAIPYSGNQQASPLASAIMYAYLNRQLREDRRSNATASMKYDTMKIGQIEQRAKEGGYYELLDEYNKAEQDFEIAKAEAQRGISQNAYNKYFATAGEIEARDASARKNLTNEERRAKRPDIDRKDVVFAEGNEKTYSIAETENDEKYLAAVNFGDLETAQRMVDEAAKAAGYTYHLYHGTKAKFNKFDPRKFGGSNGKGEGYGIYLASNKEISAPYGDNLIDSYVKFERLAEGTKRTLKTAEVRNIIKASCEAEARQSVEDGEYDSLADALKDSWVSNYVYTYGYQGMNQVYTDVADKILKANDNDGDIINEIMIASGAHYNYSAALDFYDNILTPITGIDGFHYVWGKETDNANDIYLAFRSEQIKLADPVTYDDKGNVIPLSERFNEGNEDIRWSIPESADELSREWVEKGKKYGTFDPGEKNTTGIMTPQQVDDKTRVERAVRTILGDGTLSDEYIYELGKETLLGKRSYEVESDEYAKEYLENATQQELEARVTKVLGNRNLQAGKLDVAAASYLIKQAIADGDTKKALEMEADLSAMLTHAGQFIQGWRLFKQMTPYGKLMSLQRAVRMTNEEVRPGGRKATIDENLATLLLEAQTEKEQQEAADNITADVAAQLDSSWLEKWNAWRYMSMLINPRTHARNIIGNAIFVPAVYLKDIIATGFEKIPMFRNALNADKRHAVKVKKEYADFAKFFAKDANVERDLKGGWGSFNRGVALEKAVFKGKFESFRKSMMGLLEKEDMWFKNIHYKHAFASYLQAQRTDTKSLSTNLKQNSKDAQNLIMRAHEYAVSEAFKNTYNDANAFAKMMNDLGRKHAISRFLVDSVVPFRKTPANIVKRGVEYSPIGLLTSISKGAIDYARTEKVKKQYENGEISRAEYNKYMSTKGFDGNKFIEKLASGLTGTGIFLLGVLLRSMGVLHGRARDDKDKYLRQLGRQDYSAELFGGTFSIDWAAPMNLPLFMGVELMDLLADTKEGAPIGPSTFTKPMSQFLQPIINLSMLEGVQNAIESISYSNEGEEVSDFVETVAASYFTQAMPTLLGAVARIADEKKRAYYTTNHASVDKFVQKVWNDFRAKIPAGYAIGGAVAKPPAIDVWGREISAGGIVQRIAENLVSPGYWKNINYTDVDKEVLRVYDTTKDNSVIPSKPEKYIEISGEKKYLDEWEYCEYSVQKGTYSYGYIADALKNSKYKNLSDDQKAEVIKDLYSYAKAKAKDKVSDYDISSINTYKSAYKYEQSGGSVADFYIDKEKNK